MKDSDPAPADAEATAQNLDLLTAYERLERLGRPLNAVVSVADAPERAATGPLAGRPVAVKDIIAVKGLPTRCGSPATSAEPAAEDAPLVAALRAAGAEVFATTQCLEFAAGFAHPAVRGTRNPRDPSRTAGGSSGGSAALVAAGVCDLAIGTDTGGSIRIPAAYCGVVGLKPTYGLVPVGGVFPLSPSLDHAGTLTRTAGDAIALLRAIAVPAAVAPASDPAPDRLPASERPTDDLAPRDPTPGDPTPGDLAPGDLAPGTAPVIGLLASQVADESVGEEVRLGVRRAIDLLTAAGWSVREIRPPWTGEPRRWERALAVIVAREAAGSHAGRDTSQYADGTRALLETGARVTDAEYAAARADQAELARAVGQSLAGVDVLAGPTVGYCAPAEDPPFGVGEDNAEGRFTGPYNLSGHPAVSIPVPAPGLPVGLQFAAARGADFALLRLASAAQRLLAA